MAKPWKQQFKSALYGMLLGVIIPTLAFGQATLLPNAKQQYLNDAAQPVASGQVFYYVPNTSTLKTVWSDAAKTTPLTNPVNLDIAGRPMPTGQIYGDGSYRQKVVDQDGLTVWDAVTTSTGGGSTGTSPAWSEGVMVGTIIAWTNPVLPAKYLYTGGQAISRTTYSDLFTAITYQTTVLCQSGIATVTVPTTISDVVPIGAAVEATCFAPGTTVASKASGSLTMSSGATATLSVPLRIFPWGNGDGSTTFNVPDLRGRTLVGRNNMNGVSSTALSSLYYRTPANVSVDPNAVGAAAGVQAYTMLLSNLPSYTPSGTVATPTINTSNGNSVVTNAGAVGNSTPAGGGASNSPSSATAFGQATLTSSTPAFTGVAAPFGGIAVSATLASGGSGYVNGTNLFNVAGGTCSTTPQFNVNVSGGIVSNPVLVTPGLCTVAPTNPATITPVSNPGGSGATINILYSAAPTPVIQPSVTSDYIIKVLPDDLPSGPGVTSLGGMTGSIACGTNVTCTGNTVSVNISNLSILAPSALATAAVLPNTPTYSNGTLGVGATLTAGSNTTLTVDGTAAPLNTVVLVKDQASAFQNGIYTVTQAGSGAAPWVLTRATYFDQAAEMKAGSYTFSTGGVANSNKGWALQSTVATVGTDALTFVLFSVQSAGTVTSATIAAGINVSVSGTCTITATGTCTITATGSGTVIGSAQGTYTANTNLTVNIPVDDSIPQIGEGTQIISVVYTPKLSTSTLRARFSGQGACAGADNLVVALFNGAANAFSAQMVTAGASRFPVAFDGSYAPGSTSAQTITARAGCGSTNAAFNGTTAGRTLGGASTTTLVVEEIAP